MRIASLFIYLFIFCSYFYFYFYCFVLFLRLRRSKTYLVYCTVLRMVTYVRNKKSFFRESNKCSGVFVRCYAWIEGLPCATGPHTSVAVSARVSTRDNGVGRMEHAKFSEGDNMYCMPENTPNPPAPSHSLLMCAFAGKCICAVNCRTSSDCNGNECSKGKRCECGELWTGPHCRAAAASDDSSSWVRQPPVHRDAGLYECFRDLLARASATALRQRNIVSS